MTGAMNGPGYSSSAGNHRIRYFAALLADAYDRQVRLAAHAELIRVGFTDVGASGSPVLEKDGALAAIRLRHRNNSAAAAFAANAEWTRTGRLPPAWRIALHGAWYSCR